MGVVHRPNRRDKLPALVAGRLFVVPGVPGAGKAVVCLAHISAEKLFACVLYGDAIMGRERPNLRREFML